MYNKKVKYLNKWMMFTGETVRNLTAPKE